MPTIPLEEPYKCIICGTSRYIIFPKHDESLTICSSCYRIKQEKEEEEKEKKEEIKVEKRTQNKRFVF
jgi:hypothetical protein